MGRPKMKPDLIEGPQAVKNFETAMKAAFRVSKEELDEAERKRKATNPKKRKK